MELATVKFVGNNFRPHQGIIFLTLSLKPQIFTDRKMQKTMETAKPIQKAL